MFRNYPRYPKPLLLENRICIVALTPDLQAVSFYSITDFLHLLFAFFIIVNIVTCITNWT